METNLILIHILFIGACVYFSHRSGYKSGQKELFNDLTKEVVNVVELKEQIKKRIKEEQEAKL